MHQEDLVSYKVDHINMAERRGRVDRCLEDEDPTVGVEQALGAEEKQVTGARKAQRGLGGREWFRPKVLDIPEYFSTIYPRGCMMHPRLQKLPTLGTSHRCACVCAPEACGPATRKPS